MSVRSHRNTKRSTESKISQLDGALVVDEKVLWLHVSVQNTTCMTEIDTLENLVRVTL